MSKETEGPEMCARGYALEPCHRQQSVCRDSAFISSNKSFANVINDIHFLSFHLIFSTRTQCGRSRLYFMEGPSLIVVPPTPLGYHPSPSTTASSSPDLGRLTSSEQERGSSEATIFTIYSMYGDEGNGLSLSDVRNSKYGNHTYQQSQSTNSDVFDGASLDSNGHISSKYVSATELPARTSVISNGSVHLSYLDDRPLSTYASCSSPHNDPHRSSDTIRSSKFKDLSPPPPSNAVRASYIPSETEAPRNTFLRQPTPTHSHPSSQHSVFPNGNSPTSSFRSIPPSPRPQPSELLSPPETSTLPLPQNIGTSGSKSSLVPSEGEEVDAFFVRNTYAELEMTGVKGDGYVEGVERTRARASRSRSSISREEQALDDGSEKSRELSGKELETLQSLDR